MLIRCFVAPSKGGLSLDVAVVEAALKRARLKVGVREDWVFEYCDPLLWGISDLKIADLQIHFEIPLRIGMPYGRYNVVMVNAEWFQATSWDWALLPPEQGGADLFVFKAGHVPSLFPELPVSRSIVIPWRTPMNKEFGNWGSKENRFLYLLSESVSKEAAARSVVAGWKPGWPILELWCTSTFADSVRENVQAGALIEFQTTYKHMNEKAARQRACKWHVVASAAEGFGLAMAEAVACGVPIVWSGLPVFDWSWQLKKGRIALTDLPPTEYRETRRTFTAEALETAVMDVLDMTNDDVAALQRHYTTRIKEMAEGFADGWLRVAKCALKYGSQSLRIPKPLPKGTQPPKVAVITVTRNRAAWWPNMVQNIVTQAWPISHLEWIIVDDGDEGQRLESRVEKLCEERPALTIRYVGMNPGQTIGAKRNAGVAAAGADVSVFMMMDDDDHYPSSSVASRASWLTVPGVKVAYCSTIYMYDIPRYISAINTPPMKDSPAARVSEATLAFTRAGFRPFPDVSMAEGEGFMVGRWGESVEIPPAGVIVSFIHTGNTSSRRIPKEQEPNGSHYGFSDDYFRWLFSVGSSFVGSS
jgi:hypothetical protein